MNRKMTGTKASCRERNVSSNGPRAGRKKKKKTNCRDKREQQASGIIPLGALRYDFASLFVYVICTGRREEKYCVIISSLL